MTSQTNQVSAADAIWLHMEHPTNLMYVTSVLFFDKTPDIKRLKATLKTRLLSFKRFRQYVKKELISVTSMKWVESQNFDINSHVIHMALPKPGNKAVLQDMISGIASRPLDMSKPLWDIHVIDGYENDGCALLVRIHHAIADGIALIFVLLQIMDDDPDAPWPSVEHEPERKKRWNPLKMLLDPASAAIGTTRKLTGKVIGQGMEMLIQPIKALEMAKMAAGFSVNLGKMLTLGQDTPTVLRGKLGVAKKVAWSAPLSLEEVKAVGKAENATINDVLLTCFAGTLRRYLQMRGEDVDHIEIRVIVPVTLRPLEKAAGLGNNFGTITLTMPINKKDPWERIRILKERMDEIKKSPQALITFSSTFIVGMAPKEIASKVVETFNKSATVIMTNVPGPREKLYFAGQGIENIMVWGPLGGRIGVGTAIMSYHGNVTLGLFCDAGLVPDPDVLVDGFVEEFEALKGNIEVE